MSPIVICCADASAAIAAAADRFVGAARRAIKARDSFAVALAGGATPRPLYELVARDPRRSRVKWPKVRFFWSDERAVPPTDRRSNYAMARQALVGFVAVPDEQVHRMPAESFDLDDAARAYQRAIAEALTTEPDGAPPALDLILLGLGEDGHTASLFPGSPALAERDRWVLPSHSPDPPLERLTMTLPLLNAGREVLLLAIGERKAGAVAAALEGCGPVAELPARGLQPASGELIWILDDAAAAGLRRSHRSPEDDGS